MRLIRIQTYHAGAYAVSAIIGITGFIAGMYDEHKKNKTARHFKKRLEFFRDHQDNDGKNIFPYRHERGARRDFRGS